MKSLKLILRNPSYFSVAWVFASLNILIGTWAIYIPAVKEKVMITEGELGLALFFFALGTMAFIPLTPVLMRKIGVGRATGMGIFVYCLAFLMPFLSWDFWSLSMSLFLVGAGSGFTDIAMNTLISEMEIKDGVSIMSAAHGFFSLGGVLGAGTGSLLMLYFEVPFYHILVVSLVVLVCNVVLFRHYRSFKGSQVRNTEGFSIRFLRPLLGLGIISFVIMASEGAIVDWSSLYLEKVTLAGSTVLIGLGYTLFSAAMTTGRFLGDAVSEKFGSMAIITGGLGIGMAGYVLILLADTFLAITGFGFVGLGFSVIIPELFRLGGKMENVEASRGISFIAGTGYVGFLIGPVILGLLAEMASLRLSFTALLAGALIALLTTISLMRGKQ